MTQKKKQRGTLQFDVMGIFLGLQRVLNNNNKDEYFIDPLRESC